MRRVGHRNRAGSITVITGCMFSGKTEEMIRLVRRAIHARRTVGVFKSAMETRCATEVIRTHDGTTLEARAVRRSTEIEAILPADIDLVAIEEIQFFDEGVVDLCTRLADRGVDVVCAGLDQDFRGRPFRFMPLLLALADDVVKLHAICKKCGGTASKTQRLVHGRPAKWNDPVLLIAAEESYEARCRRCHVVRGGPPDHRSA